MPEAWADRAEDILSTEGMVVCGVHGQALQHPAWKTYVEACRVMESAARALMLTPEARNRLGERPQLPTNGKFAGAF